MWPEGLPATTGYLTQFPSGQLRDGLVGLACTAGQKSPTLFTPAHHHMAFGRDGNKVKSRHEVLRRRRGREADLAIRVAHVALVEEGRELSCPWRVLGGGHLAMFAGDSARQRVWARVFACPLTAKSYSTIIESI